ncbi:hypothetical protein [Acinetobacter guillouiae]|uniref:hypothetical protein n=1 Tax=Acinetobacter guillouiae TaxID=106649 RepID=UPI0028D250FA|nr:hypothetical protein [Acinetobacter guillouiae]
MNIIKISKPFAKTFELYVDGVVSYSPRALKIAIGLEAFKVSKETMNEIVNTSNFYGEQFSLVVKLWNDAYWTLQDKLKEQNS